MLRGSLRQLEPGFRSFTPSSERREVSTIRLDLLLLTRDATRPSRLPTAVAAKSYNKLAGLNSLLQSRLAQACGSDRKTKVHERAALSWGRKPQSNFPQNTILKSSQNHEFHHKLGSLFFYPHSARTVQGSRSFSVKR